MGSVTPLRPTQRCHRAVAVVRPRSPPRISSAAAAADARGGSPGSPAEHDGAERDWREQQVHQAGAALSCDEALSLRAVQQMPIPSLDSHGRGRKRALWHSRVSLVLDGLSGIFSLACGTATLACMGIVEWSTMASLAVLVGSLSTAIGGLMVLATAVVSILAVMDTFRTLQSKENDAHLEEEALQALAAPPRRLGSMSGVHKPRGFAKDVW